MTSRLYWLGIAKLKNVFRLTINPSTKLVRNFLFNRIHTDWLMEGPTDQWTNRLTNWLTNLLIRSYKCNSIMAITTGLISSLFNVTLSVDLPTAAAPTLASWFYQSLPLFSIVLHSFLHYCVGDNLQCTCYGFSECTVLVGVLGKLFFAWNIIQSIWSSWKWSVVIHRDRVTTHYFD